MQIRSLFTVLIVVFLFFNPAFAQNFQKVWDYQHDASAENNTVQAETLKFGNLLISVDTESKIFALDASTGLLVWQKAIGRQPGRRGFTIDQKRGLLYVTANKKLFLLKASTGEQVWVQDSGWSVVGPIVTKDMVIVLSSHDGSIWGHSKSDGRLLMKSSLGKAARMWSPPLYVQHLDTIFTTTSDPGSLFSDPNKDIQYSNSLVAINSKDLSVKYSWKMVNNDVWDFDSVGKPVLIKNFIHNNNNPQDVIVALSKIGFVYILNAATGKPLSDSQFGNQVFEHLNSENKVSSTQQRFPNWPARVSETSLTVNDMRPNMVKPNQLRHVKFGEFLSPSLDYDVVTRGLHGGPEWFGSRHFKIGGKNYLAVPYNNYAWILRAKYKIKETYQNENSNPPSQRWDLKSWFKNKKTDAVKKTHLPYLEHCASCHGENRQGYYQSEATGDGYVPSLLGYTLTKKYFYGRQIQNYKKMHTNSMVTQEILDDIFHHYEKKDRSDLAAGKLEKTGFWQIFRGIDGLPINHGPWGGVAVINLETGKLIHNIPVGHLEDNQGKQHTGSVIFGGLSNVDNEGRAMLTGTVNPKAYFLDLLNGKILNSLDLKRTASVGATSYLLNDQKYWVFTSSGGRFSFYKNQSVGHNIEVFRQN